MKKVVLILIIGLCFNCNKKQAFKKEIPLKYYIISEVDSKRNEKLKNDKVPPPPHNSFYGESNMLIDGNGEIYYYQKAYFMRFCSNGMENDTLPEFLDLQPKDIIKLPKESLLTFVRENILNKNKNRQILIIASTNDTIKDNSFLKFIKVIQIPTYIIRRTTQEEDTVLQYKKNNLYYYSDSIKWDKTKIKFRD